MSGKNKILESYVHKMVEASFIKMNDKARGLKVPGPKNPIATEPVKQHSTMDLVSLLNQAEEMAAAEDLSSEDKFHLARAKQILTKVVSGKSIKESFDEPRSERDEMIDYISDTYKELRGFRPRPIWSELTDEDLKSWMSRLADEADEMFAPEPLTDYGSPGPEAQSFVSQAKMPPEKEDPHADLESLASKLGIRKSAKINR